MDRLAWVLTECIQNRLEAWKFRSSMGSVEVPTSRGRAIGLINARRLSSLGGGPSFGTKPTCWNTLAKPHFDPQRTIRVTSRLQRERLGRRLNQAKADSVSPISDISIVIGGVRSLVLAA